MSIEGLSAELSSFKTFVEFRFSRLETMLEKIQQDVAHLDVLAEAARKVEKHEAILSDHEKRLIGLEKTIKLLAAAWGVLGAPALAWIVIQALQSLFK